MQEKDFKKMKSLGKRALDNILFRNKTNSSVCDNEVFCYFDENLSIAYQVHYEAKKYRQATLNDTSDLYEFDNKWHPLD